MGYNYNASTPAARRHNHPSALANRPVVSERIWHEVGLGRMIGPMSLVEGIHTSPIGLVPKARQQGKWRMIVDLSSPKAKSVNDGITSELCSLLYARINNALEIIPTMGLGTLLTKVDLQDAYRIVPVHPGDHHLLGIVWEDMTFVDCCLPFGLRSAPKISSAVADALSWSLLVNGVVAQIHYLDDFLFFDKKEGPLSLPTILSTFGQLGVPVAEHKTNGPSSCVTFLGILVDTIRFELRLPQDKLLHLQTLVSSWLAVLGEIFRFL